MTRSETLRFWLASVLLSVASVPAWAQSPNIVISQIYGGGGNSGARYRNDFIELFNRGNSSVEVTGWTVQYASASGSSWDRTLLQGTIQPGQYYLVVEAAGAGGSVPLPTGDASGGINLSATSGKIALVSNSSVLSGPAPSGVAIIDFVGYGEANASRVRPVSVLSNTTAAIRKGAGCTDTGNNGADFSTESPTPRNSSSARNPCQPVAPVRPVISNSGVVNAASYQGGSVSAGEIITIFGSGLGPDRLTGLELTPDRQYVANILSDTRVLFDGVAAPIIYTSATQVSAVVPYAVSGRTQTELHVEHRGVASDPIYLPVTAAMPALFTLDASGRGQVAALNQDYGVNGVSHPAPKGSIITVFATGGGEIAPALPDGLVTGTVLARATATITARIGNVDAEIFYAGVAPGLVNGVLQVNIKVPEEADNGIQPVSIRVGGVTSQADATIAVAGAASGTGISADVERRFAELKRTASVPELPEIPHDMIGLPQDWLGLLCWNIQTGGASPASESGRPGMVGDALSRAFSGTYHIVAAEEIANSQTADYFSTLLPGGSAVWTSSFYDTNDAMDNGNWFRAGVTLRDSFPLFVTPSATGEFIADKSRAEHPPHVAQFEMGDFDFTLVTLHLTFADGKTAESARELRSVLDYLDWYFRHPDHDPDVVVCGDFNIPSKLSGQTAAGGIRLDDIIDSDGRFSSGERRFFVTVHEPTSRTTAARGGGPANNYDHCVLSIDTLEEFIQARRIATNILTDHPEDPEVRLTSDHFPLIALFRTRGESISLDRKLALRP